MDTDQMGNDQAQNTGTRNVTYDLTAVLYHALQGVENCQIYMNDASGKDEHRQFFQMAAEAQKKLAEQAKTLLHDCLMAETTGGSTRQDQATSAFGQQGMSAGGASAGTNAPGSDMAGEIASARTHSYDEARDDGSAFRFASGQTEGGADQFEGQDGNDRQDVRSDERRDPMTTGGGSSSSF